MKNREEIRRYLSVIKRAVALIEPLLEEADDALLQQLAETPVVTQQTVVAPEPPKLPQPEPQTAEQIKAQQIARKKHIDDLMAIDCWPEAVPSFLVASPSETDQVNRANSVLDMMTDRPMEGLKFLDFGCGEGWIAQEAMNRGVAESVGYDIKLFSEWKSRKKANYTHIFNELKRSHYDMIMLYDVLDHCEDPVTLMKQVRSVVRPDGVVYVRCHPWTSKHAMHLYKQGLNKAYLHLFLKYEELTELLLQPPAYFTRVEKNPLEAYRWWFHEFEIRKERAVKEPVNAFFHVDAFKQLLANEQQIPQEEIDEFLRRMEYQFVDYCLVPKK